MNSAPSAAKPPTAAPATARSAAKPPAVALSLVQRRAAEAILGVLSGNNADNALARVDTRGFDGATRSALIDLTYGSLRFLGELRAIVRLFAHSKPEPLIEAILWVAVFQLSHSKTASHVIVSQAVAAVETVNRGAKGFANAVLRNYLRDPQQSLNSAMERDEGMWNHPPWWVERVRRENPDWWEAILRGGNGHGPLTLRLNRRRATMTQLLEAFAARKIEVETLSDSTLVLKRPRPVDRLPGFRDGWFSVQDAGAQLAAPLLGARGGMRVLDACAAPGGKAAHVLELTDCQLLALDIDSERIERVRENFLRLGLDAETRVADAAATDSWWDGQLFDRILLDAPCTGSGVVRRHPDGKWLKRDSDVVQLAAQQRRLIDALWPTLKVGGRMLYVTCSVFRPENHEQVEAALQRHADMRRARITLPGDPASSAGQLLPGGNRKTHNHDGYFYALFEKVAS